MPSVLKHKPRILAVEDVKMIQHLLTLYFTKFKCSIDIAESGAEAIELVQANKYDFILMDIGLPDIDGVTLTETLRKFHVEQDIPIVTLTAHSDPELKKACYDIGVTEYLVKPIDDRGVHSLLQKYFPGFEQYENSTT